MRLVHGACLALALCAGCGDKSGESATTDTGFCTDAPVLMWANFGQGFMTENCQSCHASSSADRHGAPEDVTFDSVGDAVAQADRVLARATGESPDMPPEGGVSDEDRQKLEIWMRCWIDDEQVVDALLSPAPRPSAP